MTFKEGNLVRLKTEDGNGKIMRVKQDNADTDTVTLCETDSITLDDNWFDMEDLELVAESLEELEKAKNPQPMKEQTVAIVSFEGAVKREVKAVREAIKLCDSVSYFQLSIFASGQVNDGEVKIEYKISEGSYGDDVIGHNVKECLSEFLRRHGWNHANKPIAISYDGIPT